MTAVRASVAARTPTNSRQISATTSAAPERIVRSRWRFAELLMGIMRRISVHWLLDGIEAVHAHGRLNSHDVFNSRRRLAAVCVRQGVGRRFVHQLDETGGR